MTKETAQQTNKTLIQLIQACKVDTGYLYEPDRLLDEKIGHLAHHCPRVLDFGKSSRHRYALFADGQIITSDINQFDGYPDVIDDICNIQNLQWGSYDGIICLAVLEHVYAPHLAVDNLHRLLTDDGICFAYVPYLYRYHAPRDLVFQDYFRFSRDAIVYLFRDFSDVTIFPIRGRYSTILNMFTFWKHKVEKRLGFRVNRFVDRLFAFGGRPDEVTQASGYFIWAKK